MTSKKTIKAIILVRASNDEKETARRVGALRKVARERGWKVVEVYEELAQGAPEARSACLDRVAELVESGKVTKVIVDEISRIGRRNAAVLKFLNFLDQHKASLYWHAQEIETRLANGKLSQKASVVYALLEEMSRIEQKDFGERTRIGLAAARAQGRVGGRPKGLSPEAQKNASKAAALYRKGSHTAAEICEKLQISRSTYFRYLKREGVEFVPKKKPATPKKAG